MKTKALTNILAGICLLLSSEVSHAQTLDFFSGIDVNYRNIFHNERVYDLNLSLSPGFKWKMGHYWTLSAQALVPFYSDFGPKIPYLNVASLSKEFRIGNTNFLKLSGGLFTNERYGFDLKWMTIATDWFAFDVQLGYTGYMSMVDGWRCSPIGRFSGWARARFYLWRSDTELIGKFGKFAYGDTGIECEYLKHFKHTSIGLYGQYSSLSDINMGFRITVSIPGTWRAGKKVGIRPASNFSLTNNFLAKSHSMTTYATDPEENCRDGYFTIPGSEWGITEKTR